MQHFKASAGTLVRQRQLATRSHMCSKSHFGLDSVELLWQLQCRSSKAKWPWAKSWNDGPGQNHIGSKTQTIRLILVRPWPRSSWSCGLREPQIRSSLRQALRKWDKPNLRECGPSCLRWNRFIPKWIGCEIMFQIRPGQVTWILNKSVNKITLCFVQILSDLNGLHRKMMRGCIRGITREYNRNPIRLRHKM